MLITPLCFSCIHMLPSQKDGNDVAYRCKAFPKGIPSEVIRWDFDHSENKHPNQAGDYLFTPVDDKLSLVDF